MKIRPTRHTVLSAIPAGVTALAAMFAFAVGAAATPAQSSSAATPTTSAAPSSTSAPTPSAPSTTTKKAAAPAAASLSTSIKLFTVNGKGASSSTEVHGGDVLVYQLTVTNSGATPGAITLTETVPANTTYAATQTVWVGCATGSKAGTTCTQTATLAAGGKGTTTFTVAAVDPLPSGAASITNTVRASTGSCTACTASNATEAELHTTVAITSVNGHAATSAAHLARGDQVVYTVTVTNGGGSSGTTTLHNTVPTHATFSGSGWSCPSAAPAGTSCTRTVTVAAGATATATYQVTLTSYPGDTKAITDAVSTSVGTCTACSVSNRTVAFLVTTNAIFRVGTGVVSSSVSLRSGDRVVYHITVTNTGGSTGSTTLSDTVPTHMSYVGQGQGWSCKRHSSAGTSCTQTVSVPSDGKVVLRYTVLIGSSSGAAFSSVTNSVSTSAGVCSGCAVTTAVAQEGTLANTGVNAAGEAAFGVGLLGFGVLLSLTGRRRRRT